MMIPQDEINRANELIAEFNGWTKDGETWYHVVGSARMVAYSPHNNYPHRDLPFHRSWDWLHPVISKIGSLNLKEKYWKKINAVCELPVESKIEVVWQAVVDFVKWYNSCPDLY